MKKTNLIFPLARVSMLAFLFAAAIPAQADLSKDLEGFYSYFDKKSGLLHYQHSSSPRILGQDGVYFEIGLDSDFQKRPELRMYMQALTNKPLQVESFWFETDGRGPIFPSVKWPTPVKIRSGKYLTWHNPTLLEKDQVQLLIDSKKVTLSLYGKINGIKGPSSHRVELTREQLEAMRSVYAAWEELDQMYKDIRSMRQ